MGRSDCISLKQRSRISLTWKGFKEVLSLYVPFCNQFVDTMKGFGDFDIAYCMRPLTRYSRINYSDQCITK